MGTSALALRLRVHSVSSFFSPPCSFAPAWLDSDALDAEALLVRSWGREALSRALVGMRSSHRMVKAPVLVLAIYTVM